MRMGADADRVSVVVDAAGRHALWPADLRVPPHWEVVAPAQDRISAIAFIEQNWTDMRPAVSASLPAAAGVPGRLAALARSGPQMPAIFFEEEVVTRVQLDRRAAMVAQAILAAGGGAETIVAVALGRSPEAVAAYLGTMRAGAAFLPIDPAYPAERIAYQLADSEAAIVVTDAASGAKLPVRADVSVIEMDRLPVLFPDEALPCPVDPGQLAYVIYTSGSTGRPKGVAVDHGPLAMHVETTAAAYEMGAGSRELHFLSFAFDGAHERWMVPLWAGGSIVLRGDALWTPAETLAVIRNAGVTHAGFPTSYMAELAAWAEAIGEAPEVECYSFGGEAMARATFERIGKALHPRIMINGYGPTETVISPMVWKVSAGTSFEEPYAPIGAPVGDRSAHVLGPDLLPVPAGEVGELWLGGTGLARGYLRRPALTAERFLPDPFAPGGGRMYRTGDMVRCRSDGSFAYVGREDGQVKIRGFRIELGEIEARLRDEATVAEAVVLKREGPAGASLVGYVTPATGRTPEPGRLRARLASALPEALVPSRIVVLDRLPLMPNGKVDRAALPEPALTGPPALLPRTVLEQQIASIWSSILGIAEIGVDQPFFELGGDSLSALRLLARLQLAFPGRRLGIADLLGNPTVESLAARLADDTGPDAGEGAARLIELTKGGRRPPLVLFPGLLVSLREYEPLLRRLGPDQPAFGFACASLTHDPRPLPDVATLAQDYAGAIRRRVGSEGCVLLGWSWGGVLAFETAHRLAGHVRVHFIAMADACGLEPPFAPGSLQPLADAERRRCLELVGTWLGASSMAAQWAELQARMDEETMDCFLAFLAAEPQPLPTDGPLVGSRERILHTLVDHALQMRELRLQPQSVAIRSFEAERSRREGKPILDWRGLASPVSVEVVPATDHLDIVLARPLHERLAELLADIKTRAAA